MADPTWSEVFISHRGVSMKMGFANCLHHALVERGITSFLDMETLTKGNDVREDFPEAVRRAIVQVPILTDDFGSSSWCLDELAEMIDSMRECGSKVFPVFYGLKPEDLRKEEGSFGMCLKAFLHDHTAGEEKIARWKNALKEVSWLEGFRLKTHGGAQGALIKDLVTAINREISRRYSADTSGLVGVGEKVQEVLELLCLKDTARVYVVLIWGMGGVGKTTLAGAIHSYSLSLKEFEGVCYIRNCGDLAPCMIQGTILKELLGREKMDISRGKACLKDGLKRKKVLLILDDINDFSSVEQILDLKEMCSGSRLLLTSRNRDVFPYESDMSVLRG